MPMPAVYLLMMFYTMVAGWAADYVYVMGSGQLHGGSVEAIEDKFTGMLASPGLMVAITLAVIVCCIGICSLGLQNGVERVTKIMMLALIVLMIVMAVNSLFSGNEEGLKFYLVPVLSVQMPEAGNALFYAMTQAFFTLSVGMGSMEIFGSYIGKERKLSGEAKSVMYLDKFCGTHGRSHYIASMLCVRDQPGQGTITSVYDPAECVQPHAGRQSVGNSVLHIHVICGAFHGYCGVLISYR